MMIQTKTYKNSSSFTLFSQPYYDTYNECYKTIITINSYPEGPLINLVNQIKFNRLSPFQEQGNCCPIEKCGLALNSIRNRCNLMTLEELPDLFSFLLENNYKIDTSVTKILKNNYVNNNSNNNKTIIALVQYNI
jgi:hypothetical protein